MRFDVRVLTICVLLLLVVVIANCVGMNWEGLKGAYAFFKLLFFPPKPVPPPYR
jgi:hypothetical protein